MGFTVLGGKGMHHGQPLVSSPLIHTASPPGWHSFTPPRQLTHHHGLDSAGREGQGRLDLQGNVVTPAGGHQSVSINIWI